MPKSSSIELEKRFAGKVEARAADEGSPKIDGYAALFNSITDIGGYFQEKIAPGAFANTIKTSDVRALFNHDPCYVLGRSANKTLALAEDSTGLRFEADPPDATWASDLVSQIKRGDISQCSFQFRALREEWDETGEIAVRTLLEVELIDVSVVTFPAYDDTSVGVRSLAEWRSANMPKPRITPNIAARLRMRDALRQRELAG